MDNLKLKGRNLSRVLNVKQARSMAPSIFCHNSAKIPNLKWKTGPKQLLGYLLLAFVLPIERLWNWYKDCFGWYEYLSKILEVVKETDRKSGGRKNSHDRQETDGWTDKEQQMEGSKRDRDRQTGETETQTNGRTNGMDKDQTEGWTDGQRVRDKQINRHTKLER
jgi:hypothetical protein